MNSNELTNIVDDNTKGNNSRKRSNSRRRRKNAPSQLNQSGRNSNFGMFNQLYTIKTEYFENFYAHKRPVQGNIEVHVSVNSKRLMEYIDIILVTFRKQLTDIRIVRSIQNLYGIRSGTNLYETLEQVKSATVSAIETILVHHSRYYDIHNRYTYLNIGSLELPEFLVEMLSFISAASVMHRIPGMENSLIKCDLYMSWDIPISKRDEKAQFSELAKAIFILESFSELFCGSKTVKINQFDRFYRESKTLLSCNLIAEGEELIFQTGMKNSPESIFYAWLFQISYVFPESIDKEAINVISMVINKDEFKTALLTYCYKHYGAGNLIPSIEVVSAEVNRTVKELDSPLAS